MVRVGLVGGVRGILVMLVMGFKLCIFVCET